MEVWTEVINEDVVDVHVGSREVIVPINDGLTGYQIRDILDQIEARRVREQLIDEWQKMRNNIRTRRQAREQIKQAGYEESEIPL